MEKPIKIFCCLIFCFFIIPFKAYSVVIDITGEERFTDCYSFFSNSDLNHEKYSEANLKMAMESSDYERIKDLYPTLKKKQEDNY